MRILPMKHSIEANAMNRKQEIGPGTPSESGMRRGPAALQGLDRRRLWSAAGLCRTWKLWSAAGLCRIWTAAAMLLSATAPAPAQQEQRGVCTAVGIEIKQELTLERIGFEATLEVTNNDADNPLTDFSANLTFSTVQEVGESNVVVDAANLFFVRAPELKSIADVDGNGVILPGRKAVIQWFLIPKPQAGGTSPQGVYYTVGCDLAARLEGEQLPPELLSAYPDKITVLPHPLLDITYFQPRDVQGDDPFTAAVEAPVPFTLGVLVRNVGYGKANSVMVYSEQPKIVENEQGLLLIARLLGVRIMDSEIDRKTLTVNVGDLNPGDTRKAAWDMITSLSGEFVDFKADYTHDPGLGGEETSIITNMAAHFLVHEVLNDQAGRDQVLDFLADTDRDEDRLADTLYESQGQILPVNTLAQTSVSGTGQPGATIQVGALADRSDWVYIRVTDPGEDRLPITSVVRNDGKELDEHNYWTSHRYNDANERLDYLHIFDLVTLGSNTYDVTYGGLSSDTNPPVTHLEFDGPVAENSGTYYITPQTMLYFLSEDENPVSIFYSEDGGGYVPAYPFSITEPGEHIIRYYAYDSEGNGESTNMARVVVDEMIPGFVSVAMDGDELILVGNAVSVRNTEAGLSFQVVTQATEVSAEVEIFRGVKAWPQISGVPASPTVQSNIVLGIEGRHVEFYKYRLNGGGWSAETSVTNDITLSGLADGPYTLELLARHRAGTYPDEGSALSVSWTVESGAHPTLATCSEPFPTRLSSCDFTVGGAGVTSYWCLVDSLYAYAETNVASPRHVERSAAGSHQIEVWGRVAGVLQPTNEPTTATWTVDPDYGYSYGDLELVYDEELGTVGSNAVTFTWDGTDNSAVPVLAGWYTLRLTLVDELGYTNFTTRAVEVLEMRSGLNEVVAADRGPSAVAANRRWAVWIDQSDGTNQVYAGDLYSGSGPTQLTLGPRTKAEPATDGDFVVWQARELDGSWDLYVRDLGPSGVVTRVTATPGIDETRPDIDWPWIVYQWKSAARPGDPWQVAAVNLAVGGAATNVSVSGADEIHPMVHAGRVVWQDWRDAGPGEIYLKNLETDTLTRITDNSAGQYSPDIWRHWVVWADNRHGQLELYAYDLRKGSAVRLTDTPRNESNPRMCGSWLVYSEDSVGAGTENLHLMHLPSLGGMGLTRTATFKSHATLAGRHLVWMEGEGAQRKVRSAALPAFQAVARNRNAVPVTQGLADRYPAAGDLLTAWQAEAGVTSVTHFAALVPQVQSETAGWDGDSVVGTNFVLSAGDFLWIAFDADHVLDLGDEAEGTVDLSAGLNVLSYSAFPSGYSSFDLLRQLGLGKANVVRILDAHTGRWRAAESRDGAPLGHDFDIPHSAVLLIDMAESVTGWRPE